MNATQRDGKCSQIHGEGILFSVQPSYRAGVSADDYLNATNIYLFGNLKVRSDSSKKSFKYFKFLMNGGIGEARLCKLSFSCAKITLSTTGKFSMTKRIQKEHGIVVRLLTIKDALRFVTLFRD